MAGAGQKFDIVPDGIASLYKPWAVDALGCQWLGLSMSHTAMACFVRFETCAGLVRGGSQRFVKENGEDPTSGYS